MHAGTKLGPYEVTALIGAGGMGEVFRARDTRLNRDVAVKVLPKDFASDADRLRRFEQEARTLAALNHPNVLTIHYAGVHEGAPYLVSELLEGKTLREEMNGGALPVRKAVDYALQIAHGLAAAHGKGIIHRDLKPENIFVTKEGRVKILDFGLAKLRANPKSEIPNLKSADAPTLRIDAEANINTTEPGMVLGTPAYMSPEQVCGEPADHRADIFAFGCVLYEMLSGTRAFRRDTPVASMNAVLSEEPPPLTTTNTSIPPALERIAHRCLEKEPDRRFHSAHDLAFAIESGGTISTSAQPVQKSARAELLRFLPWAVAALAIVVALGVFLAGRRASSTSLEGKGNASTPPPVRKLEIRIPLPAKNARPRLTGLAISPDGRKLAYANADGLWLRRLDQLAPPVLISPAEKASSPFWSPRSTDVAWFEGASLKRAPVSGGRPKTICRITHEVSWSGAEGGTWLENDEIIFATGGAGLDRVPAQGGNATVALPPADGELDFHQVSALPDGRGVIFVVHRKEGELGSIDTIATWNLKDTKNGKRVLFQRPGSHLSHPIYSSSGHVVFTDQTSDPDENGWALPISLSTLERTGEPFRRAEGGFLLSVSAEGTLALVHQNAAVTLLAPRQLVWVDRTGRIGNPLGPVQNGLSFPRLSPDERSVSFSAGDSVRAFRTWILDTAGGSALPLQPEGDSERNPFWLPSGREIAVTAIQTNSAMSIIRAVEGSRATDIIGQGLLLHVSASGQYAFMRHGRRSAPVTNFFIRLSGDRQPTTFPKGLASLGQLRRSRMSLSPNDATLAFQSDESGQSEIWAVAFPGFTNRVLVSRGGGISPQWSRDGKELFYLSEDGYSMMVVPMVIQNGPQFGAQVKLFDLPVSIFAGEAATLSTSLFDVSADGQRFLMMRSAKDLNAPEPDRSPTVLLIQNWFEEYRDKK